MRVRGTFKFLADRAIVVLKIIDVNSGDEFI